VTAVEYADVGAAKRESLLNLWEYARREHDAAGHLLLADSRGLGHSVALHLLRGWHALAVIRARQSDSPDPELESFTVERESEILAPIARRKLSSWEESFNAISEAALAPPWLPDAPGVDRKQLRLQLGFLGRCAAAYRTEVMASSPRSWTRLFEMRQVLTAAAAAVLIVAAVDLGRRLEDEAEQAVFPESVEDSIPDTVKADLSQLNDFRPRGYAWDGSENILFGERLIVSLSDTRHPDVISVSVDGNDRYSLRLMKDDEQIGALDVGPSPTGGLEVYTVTVPEEAFKRGFDFIVIEVLEGDGFHSIGHLLLNEPKDRDPL
jgi:hypothetical protein